jgi:hypothetical protein
MKLDGRDVQVKSTSTADEAAARQFAETYFGQCLLRRDYPDVIEHNASAVTPCRRFDMVADKWLDQKKAMAGSDKRNLRGWYDANKLVTAPNGLSAFFKRTDIAAISTDQVRDYLQFAAEHGKKRELAPATQRNHICTLNGILKFAAERRLIASVPPMPKVRLKDNPRSYFTEDEFRALCQAAGVLAGVAAERGELKAEADWNELREFLIFMVATFLRAGEWKELRQKHCCFIDGDNPYVQVTVPNAKTINRRVVSMPEAIGVWRRILDREGVDPERFIFKSAYQNRDTAQARMRDSFEDLLRYTGLALDPLGKKRTIYSLRHTALMFRLINGDNVDLLMLARNAGTSIDQLDRFYLSHAQPAMKVANLHSAKPKPARFEEQREPRRGIQLRASVDEPAL